MSITLEQRVILLMRICPEYENAIRTDSLIQLMKENRSLYIAISVFLFCEVPYCDTSTKLVFELDSWLNEPDAESTIPAACQHLVSFFSEYGETEKTAVLLHWMRINGFSGNNSDTLRL